MAQGATSTVEGKRSWRGAPRGVLVRRSRHLWRWPLSGLALALILLAVFWAWPRPLPRTLLLVLTSDREERTLPLVPHVEGDLAALIEWARGAKVPVCQRQLVDVSSPEAFVRRLAVDSGSDRLAFKLDGNSGELRLGAADTLVIYIKGHGLAIDVSAGERPDVRPLLVKSLSEADLAAPWFRDETHTIDVAALLESLVRLTEGRKLVILDAVHLNYDPRLGTLVNAFPQAVRDAAERLPQRNNLWVLAGQDDGELAVSLPGAGRSALVDSLTRQLERGKGDAAHQDIQSLVAGTQRRLNALMQGGRGSFQQTLQTILAPSAGSAAELKLPTSPPPIDDKKAKSGGGSNVGAEVARAAQYAVPSEVTTVVTGARQVSGSAAGQAVKSAVTSDGKSASPAATDPAAAPASGQATTPGTATAADKGQPAQPAAAASASPAVADAGPPKTNLDLAWEARDRLRSKSRDLWSPVHVAPDQWRRVEGILAGFDEEQLSRDLAPSDQATLQLLRADLEILEIVFRGGEGPTPATGECQNIAESYRRFAASAAYRSFQARQASGLEGANAALKTFAEGVYRALDYVRLHGQMAAILDGGPLLNDGPLETLLDNLRTLRGLLQPAGLAGGRLTEARLRELTRLAAQVETLRTRIDDDITAYAKSTAAAPQSPGRLLRARLLLHSPLLTADVRRALHRPTDAKTQANAEPPPTSEPLIGERLAANLRLDRKLLGLAATPAASSGKGSSAERPTAARLNRLLGAVDAADMKAALPSWASLGRQFREFAEALPTELKSDFSARAGGQSELPPPDMLDLYLVTLLMDARDAPRWRDRTAPLVSLAQPLKPELVPDRVELAAPSQMKLPGTGTEGELRLTLQVQTEKPLPYPVTLELNWDRDLNVVRKGSGTPLRSGRNELLLDSDKSEIVLSVQARRESRDSSPVMLRTQARFASAAPAAADIACLLPRPDEIELTIAADDNVDAARRRIWFQQGQQGGRLNFFANREKSFQIYLTNLSSEDKHLHARLYRVPPWAAGPAGRLFDPRTANQLLRGPADLDTRLAQPGADAAQLLRGYLLAQTNEKEPLALPTSPLAVKVPLVAPAPAAPAPAPPPAAAGAKPPEKGDDISGGLVLVLSSADGKSKPFVKWIELQMIEPDNLLEVKEQALRDGKLSFRVGLKDPRLVEEMDLAQQPVALVWESQSLPPEVREPTKEAVLTAADDRGALFSALAGASLSTPIFVQLHVDRDPRGLVVSFDRRGDALTLSNLKENRLPTLHISRLLALAQRAGAPPEKTHVLIRPSRPWLPYPAPPADGEEAPLRDVGQPVLVRVDARTPTVRLQADLGADVAPKYFAEGARVRLSIEQQTKEYAADRQVSVRLTGIDGGGLKLNSEVSDFLRVDFEPIEVKQDKRIELVADVVGERVGPAASDSGPATVPIILDRTPPMVSQISAEKMQPQPPNPQSVVRLRCQADDGEGSGIDKVEFAVGFDLNSNDRLDELERRPPVPAIRAAEGIYVKDYPLPADAPSEYLLVEATATDKVQHVSAVARYSLQIPRKVEGGGQRTTFGGKPIEPGGGKLDDGPVRRKK